VPNAHCLASNAYLYRMSSHHFVKEGQEPALLVLDVVSWDIIGPLLEWAPLVIVGGAALEGTLQQGIKVDAVVTPGEEGASLEHRLADQGPVKILIQPASSDPFTATLDYLVHTHQSAVNIITITPSPLIHIITQNAPPLNVSIITGEHKWSLFKSGPYKKWHPARTSLQIHQSGASRQITTPSDGLITLNPTAPFWIAESL
jgi:hypothetical protein